MLLHALVEPNERNAEQINYSAAMPVDVDDAIIPSMQPFSCSDPCDSCSNIHQSTLVNIHKQKTNDFSQMAGYECQLSGYECFV